MDKESENSVILPLVLKVIKGFSENHDTISEKKYSLYFQATIIQTSPYLFITDGVTTIQAEHSTNKAARTNQKSPKGPLTHPQFAIGTHVPLKPDNQIRSNYYSVYANSIITFNCRDQEVEEASQFPHPYCPYFHFQSRYQQFLLERRQIKWKNEYNKIGIFGWNIRLVNIANTGYYAPIIEISQQKMLGPQRFQPSFNFGLILYNKEIKYYMEKFRLKDLRILYEQKHRQEANQENKAKKISLAYYFKTSVRGNKNMNTLNPHIDIDEDMEICKYDKGKNVSFIAYSDLKGMCYSMKKLDKYLVGAGKIQTSAIDFEAAQKLLNYRRNHMQDQEKDIDDLMQELELAQQFEEQQEPAQQAEKPNSGDQSQDFDEESQSDSQDPLRKAYLRQLAKRNPLQTGNQYRS